MLPASTLSSLEFTKFPIKAVCFCNVSRIPSKCPPNSPKSIPSIPSKYSSILVMFKSGSSTIPELAAFVISFTALTPYFSAMRPVLIRLALFFTNQSVQVFQTIQPFSLCYRADNMVTQSFFLEPFFRVP